MFSPEQCERIERETFVARVESHVEVASTNDLAMQRVADTNLRRPLLIHAQRQTAGRGRGDNRWWSGDGALTFSLLVEEVVVPQSLPVSLAVGVAVCDALRAIASDAAFGLKWPNDVYHCRRKIAGILVERPSQSAGDTVIGVGLNVNNSAEAAPAEVSGLATSLREVAGKEYGLHTVLIELLQQIGHTLAAMKTHPEELHARWQRLCLLTGKQVTIATGHRQQSGRCVGIDTAGALIIETKADRLRFATGHVLAFS